MEGNIGSFYLSKLGMEERAQRAGEGKERKERLMAKTNAMSVRQDELWVSFEGLSSQRNNGGAAYSVAACTPAPASQVERGGGVAGRSYL